MSAVNPKRADGVEARELGEECMLHDARSGAVHVINDTAAFVWRLCDGSHTLDDMAASMKEAYDTPPDADVHQDIRVILDDLAQQGVLEQPAE